ncbi:Lrp/AsnC family transcriptional regulator [Candidatus Micrarchaeota archaeon]|nr:Lrp/AsnC family transcriptional regulator [Candidatus Micrarchaeota archaeon]MBU1165500.1 Lrp/AsnC family transcriptional regulator [Candidatus Micrarchaeota archaeon]MBU1886338.1 Lrp/AsnC family transcriptional regulator [Candidatus Micrarchaeota archaeon]
MEQIDDVDWKIIHELKRDSRLSARELAKRTKLSSATINRRIRKLEDTGIIKAYTLSLNYEKLGKETVAYVLIRAKPGANYSPTMDDMANREEIEDIGAIAGEFDLIVKIRVAGIKELDDFVFNYLRKFPAITQTQTLIVMRNWK